MCMRQCLPQNDAFFFQEKICWKRVQFNSTDLRNHRGRRPPQQPPRIPDIVVKVERNGDSQFNFGPLPLGSSATPPRIHPHKKEKQILVQATTSLSNRSGKVLKHPNQEKNNRRILTGSKQRNNSLRKVNTHSETHARNTSSETLPVAVAETKRVDQEQFHSDDHSDYDEEDDITEHSQGSFASTPNKTFQDNISVNNIAVELSYVNGHSSYVFPEKQHPLKECFYNPSGYACCNRNLNDEIVRTFEQLVNDPTFSTCNIQKIANVLQRNCSRRFKMKFETIVGLSDYAQRVNFKKDLVCKVELAGRYMLAYATPEHDGDRAKREDPAEQVEDHTSDDMITGESSTTVHSLLI
ncbi:ground-like domain protein [Ancylostoma caninum]|uniref:Ground-like domain protein n=1 Tax=Ancylostoma caninum TaxID=29170 RepID=A0A368G9X6_ANCCA|nr:ground-like domain protein [Ancylostoma caninum]